LRRRLAASAASVSAVANTIKSCRSRNVKRGDLIDLAARQNDGRNRTIADAVARL
jgi:hypothetical protein